ncbi:MAG TPA: hypothetical protein VJ723_11525, partial [Candidatus Angelobacter sp.]|nr:hypothetical protein [Candidatus Angelobacter sp.]
MKKLTLMLGMLLLCGSVFSSPVSVPDVSLDDPPQLSGGLCTLSFSATPVFTAGACSIFSMTLTGNVTSSTVTGAQTGQIIAVTLTQGAGGPWKFAWPGNFLNPPTRTPVAAKAESCTFVLLADTHWHNLGCGEFPFKQLPRVTGTGNVIVLQNSPTINTPTITAPIISDEIWLATGGSLSAALTAAGNNGIVVVPANASPAVLSANFNITTNYTTLRCEP